MNNRDWLLYPVLIGLSIGFVQSVVRHEVLPRLRRRREVVEQCEVCAKWLTKRQVRELRADATDDAELDIGLGGTYMVATYCRKHFPSGVASTRVES